MIGLVLLVLIVGALIAAIWGRKTAQNCLGSLFWFAISGISFVIIAITMAISPQFRAGALVVGTLWVACVAWMIIQFSTESRQLKRRQEEHEKQRQVEHRQREQTSNDLLAQLRTALTHQDDEQCRVIGEQLQHQGLLWQALPLAEMTANDIDPLKRLCAIRVLQYPALQAAILRGASGARNSARGRVDPKYAMQVGQLLCRLARNSNETKRNRVAAIVAVGKGGYYPAIPQLFDLLHDPVGDVRAAVCNSVARLSDDEDIGPQEIEQVIAALHDPYERVRREAAQALGDLESFTALQPLQMVAANVNEIAEVRQAANAAVEKIKHRARTKA
jgi:hypothetical protein